MIRWVDKDYQTCEVFFAFENELETSQLLVVVHNCTHAAFCFHQLLSPRIAFC